MGFMKTNALLMTALLGLAGHCSEPEVNDEIWVANRVDDSLSVIDTETDSVIATLPMPGEGEPMYVNHAKEPGLVFVGDRANNLVVAFDVETRAPVARISVGEGVFHQWALPDGSQLWVNNDIARTTSVVSIDYLATIGTIPMPGDLAAMPGVDGALPKPHDVLVSPDGDAAFVSYIGFEGPNDYIVRFDAETLQETARAAVGKDVHLTATGANDLLYAPCQGSDAVYILERDSLEVLSRTFIPGAHGAGMANDGDRLYITNLPAGGDMGLFALNTRSGESLSDVGADAPMVGVPHNIAINADDTKVYVTHSGSSADLVSVFEVSDSHPIPSGVSAEVSVGLNPFGLGFVDR